MGAVVTDEDRDRAPINPQAWPEKAPPELTPDGYVSLGDLLLHAPLGPARLRGPEGLDARSCQERFERLSQQVNRADTREVVRTDDGRLEPLAKAYWLSDNKWDLYLTGQAQAADGQRGWVFLPHAVHRRRSVSDDIEDTSSETTWWGDPFSSEPIYSEYDIKDILDTLSSSKTISDTHLASELEDAARILWLAAFARSFPPIADRQEQHAKIRAASDYLLGAVGIQEERYGVHRPCPRQDQIPELIKADIEARGLIRNMGSVVSMIWHLRESAILANADLQRRLQRPGDLDRHFKNLFEKDIDAPVVQWVDRLAVIYENASGKFAGRSDSSCPPGPFERFVLAAAPAVFPTEMTEAEVRYKVRTCLERRPKRPKRRRGAKGTQANIENAEALRAQGMPIRKIAAQLGMSRSTIHDWLRK